MNNFNINICWNHEYGISHEQLVELLHLFGDLLPDPLSQRIVIEDYATKLMKRAEIGFALDNNRFVGLMAIYVNDKQGHIAHLPLISVLPSYQGYGIGKSMMLKALSLARQKGMRQLWLNVMHDNHVARGFYRSLGFQMVDSEPPKIKMSMNLVTSISNSPAIFQSTS